MTGAEYVAGQAAKAAITAGHEAVKEQENVKQKLLDMAEDSPALREASEQYARRIQIKQSILTKIYEPLAKLLGIRTTYFDEQFADDLSEKMADIPEANVIPPQPSVALPAMQGLGWSLDEPDLKEMYLNLLAAASDNRQSSLAHPSFAEVIKQLSAVEARNLTLLLRSSDAHACAQLRLQHPGDRGYNIAVSSSYQPPDGVVRNRLSDPSEGVWVDNWVRLGLVTVSFGEHLTQEGRYDWVESRPETAVLRSVAENENARDGLIRLNLPEGVEAPTPTARSFTFEKGIIRVTDFGKRFLQAVDSPEHRVT